MPYIPRFAVPCLVEMGRFFARCIPFDTMPAAVLGEDGQVCRGAMAEALSRACFACARWLLHIPPKGQ